MKSLLVSAALIFCCMLSFAQKSRTVFIDTINLRGILIDSYNKPVPNTILLATQKDLTYQVHRISATTDANGMFTLYGAKPNDTITVDEALYRKYTFYNQGSRFIVIQLPHQEVIHDNKPVQITASRIYPRFLPKFTIQPFTPSTETFCGTEQFASFPGGWDGFHKYVQRGLTYPQAAVRHNIEGMVEASFDVTRDGSVDNVKILKGIGYGCDDVVTNIVKASPKWVPYHSNGRARIQTMTVSIEFKLTDK